MKRNGAQGHNKATTTTAFILAGGEGTRLLGSEHPKALMRMVFKPVIEILTDKLLERDAHARIFVIIKRKWSREFDLWLKHYKQRLLDRKCILGRESPIELVIEENHRHLLPPGAKKAVGTLPAIWITLEDLRHPDGTNPNRKIAEDEPFFVFNGDNYFDDDLGDFLTMSRKWLRAPNCFCVNASYNLSDYREARRFGVIDPNGSQINELIEKPPTPTPDQTLISTGCYAFRYDERTREAMLTFLKKAGKPHGKRGGSVGTVIDLAYLIIEQIRPTAGAKHRKVAMHHELKGVWFDIGEPRNFTLALKHYVSRHVDPIRTVGDLEGRPHGSVADQSFLFAMPNNIELTERRITVTFKPNDPIAHKKAVGKAGRWIKTLAQLVAAPFEKRKGLIQRANGNRSDAARLYLAGGVLLIDTIDAAVRGLMEGGRSRIPLQRRDFGARLDPDRLTMPAGSLDTLSFTECCYAEMQEEMVCYGDQGEKRVLFYLLPTATVHPPLSQQAFLDYVIEKQLQIPGIDPALLKHAHIGSPTTTKVFEVKCVFEHDLSARPEREHIWEIVLKLGEKEMDRGWFFVSLEPQTQTLECRKIAKTDLSEVGDNADGFQPVGLYGNLAGIADGEGYGRLPILFGADSLIDYVRRLGAMSHDALLDHIYAGPDTLLRILCSGEAGSGRFNRFDFPASIVTTTSSVGAMLSFLPSIFH